MIEFVLTKKETCSTCEGRGRSRTEVVFDEIQARNVFELCADCDGTGIKRTEIELAEALRQLSLKGVV